MAYRDRNAYTWVVKLQNHHAARTGSMARSRETESVHILTKDWNMLLQDFHRMYRLRLDCMVTSMEQWSEADGIEIAIKVKVVP